MGRAHEFSEARCPRCGYDQRGVAAAWTDSCPLTGVCTECGLEFVWCEVLMPEKFEPRWCVEFEPRAGRVPRAIVTTLIRSFWPWGFWTRLQMSHRVRWLRLAVYVLALLLLPLLVYAAGQTGLSLMARQVVQSQIASQAAWLPTQIQQQQASLQQLKNTRARTAAQQQSLASMMATVQANLARLQGIAVNPETIDSSPLTTTWEAVAQPLASTSSVSIVSAGGGSRAYPAPTALLELVLESRSYWGLDVLVNSILQTLLWLAIGVATTLALPLSFLMLPLSLRKAKVRWAHIARVSAYSVFIPVISVTIGVIALWLAAVVWQSVDLIEATTVYSRYAPWLAVAMWWQAATRNYLRIPHAWFTIAVLTLMCLLVLLGVVAAINHRLAWEMLDLFDWLIP